MLAGHFTPQITQRFGSSPKTLFFILQSDREARKPALLPTPEPAKDAVEEVKTVELAPIVIVAARFFVF
jgi:hypothetical protein